MNCPLYSGWRKGQCKAGIRSREEGLVEVVDESIKVEEVEVRGGVGVCDGMRHRISVVNLGEVTLKVKAVGVRYMEATMSGRVLVMPAARGWGAETCLMV